MGSIERRIARLEELYASSPSEEDWEHKEQRRAEIAAHLNELARAKSEGELNWSPEEEEADLKELKAYIDARLERRGGSKHWRARE